LPGSQHRPKTRTSVTPEEIVGALPDTVALMEHGRRMFGIVKPGTLRSAAGEVVTRLKDTQARLRP